MDSIYSRRANSDEIYFIKALIMEENIDAIFLKGLDCALIGSTLNIFNRTVPVYSRHVIIEMLSKRDNIPVCHMIEKMCNILKKYKVEKNSPIIIDIMWEVEIEIGEISETHEKIKNIRYEELGG